MPTWTVLFALLTACEEATTPNGPSPLDSDPQGDTDLDDDNSATDNDGDGFPADIDCDDTDPAVFPGAAEVCDDIDNDCNDLVDDNVTDEFFVYEDGDGDGFGGASVRTSGCEIPKGFTDVEGDCNDADAQIYPGADELCDGVDNNCDDNIDNSPIDGIPAFVDADGDGFGDPAAPTTACPGLPGTAGDNSDCDDTDSDTFPGAAEVCNDGIDQDCDDVVDGFCGEVWDTIGVSASLLGSDDGDGIGNDLDMGDINGDGTPDILVHSRTEVSAGGNTGSGYVVHGPLTSDARIADAADARVANHTTTYAASEQFKSVGDLNDDGFDDVLFGDPSANSLVGTGYLYYGPLSGDTTTATADVEIRDQTPYMIGFFQNISQGRTDLDGDGFDDLIVGQLFYPDLSTQTGAAFVYYGPVSLTGSWETLGYGLATTVADAVIEGGIERANFGDQVQGVGDINADGLDDLAVMSQDAGLSIIEGSESRWSGDIAADDLVVATFAHTNEYGQRISAAGDQDGDGTDDILVATTGTSHDAYVFAGPLAGELTDDDAIATVDAPTSIGDTLPGYKIDATGDVNGDSVNDILVLANTPAILLGPAVGGLSIARGSADVRIIADSGADIDALHWVGDQDSDGLDDLVIGQTTWEDDAGLEVGRAGLITGATIMGAALP